MNKTRKYFPLHCNLKTSCVPIYWASTMQKKNKHQKSNRTEYTHTHTKKMAENILHEKTFHFKSHPKRCTMLEITALLLNFRRQPSPSSSELTNLSVVALAMACLEITQVLLHCTCILACRICIFCG